MKKFEVCDIDHHWAQYEPTCPVCTKPVNLKEPHCIQNGTMRLALHLECGIAAALSEGEEKA